MPEGSQTGQDQDLPIDQETPSSTKLEKPKVRRKINFHPHFRLSDANVTEIKSDQVDNHLFQFKIRCFAHREKYMRKHPRKVQRVRNPRRNTI
jgi:hypothetical protein